MSPLVLMSSAVVKVSGTDLHALLVISLEKSPKVDLSVQAEAPPQD